MCTHTHTASYIHTHQLITACDYRVRKVHMPLAYACTSTHAVYIAAKELIYMYMYSPV